MRNAGRAATGRALAGFATGAGFFGMNAAKADGASGAAAAMSAIVIGATDWALAVTTLAGAEGLAATRCGLPGGGAGGTASANCGSGAGANAAAETAWAE